MKRFIKRKWFKLKQLFDFYKLWKNNFWFDYEYLEILIVWKLKQMAVNFWYKGHLQESKKKAKEMIRVIQKFRKLENVLEDICKEHDRKFPNKPKETFKTIKLYNSSWSLEDSDDIIEYRKTKEGKKEEKELLTLSDKEVAISRKLRKEIYLDIANQIENWWD